MSTAQELIDEVTINILADKDWDEFRWMELHEKVKEDLIKEGK